MPLTSAAVKQAALARGFDLCGIAPAEPLPEGRALEAWLARGFHGTMAYMARTVERRRDVLAYVPGARAVIVLGTLYHTARPASLERTGPEALVSRYAWGRDYHEVIRARLEALVDWMRAEAGEPFDARVAVDTAPVLERAYAQRAGLGWAGKNTCLINPRLGSWLFLSEIICSLPLEPDDPEVDRCGACRLCLDACPTGAFADERVLDATRCISYLTIELKGAIPEPLRPAIGTHVFGCDICQEVCPWNAAAPVSEAPEWQPRAELDGTALVDLWRRSDAELSALLRDSALARAGLRGLRRNLAVALGNTADPAAAAALEAPIDAPSLDDPVVREHV
ncbi:MAG TPA: tRNA epoxyqueuosine(34) reductase QueG, partial [Vicinamibacterales bacterium]|nr:tRNA epoxyqueuosine(34) reductase QueG [Vicinamibacterales bacterium]